MQEKVRAIKLSFVAIAIALTGVLFWQATGTEERLVFEAPDKIEDAEKTQTSTAMVAPHYFGEDLRGNKYDVRAERAEQTMVDGVIEVVLSDIEAHALSQSGNEIKFVAGQGYFARNSGGLFLEKGVVVTGLGYEISSTSLSGNLNTGEGYSDEPVTITGLGGTITGGTFKMIPGKFELMEGVRARIWPDRLKERSK